MTKLIGTKPGQVPTNADLGTMAYQDSENVTLQKDGGAALNVNRKSNDGDLAVFSKDGSTVGSIGVDDSDDIFLNGENDHIRFHVNGSQTLNLNNAGSFYPAAGLSPDLGISGRNWRDLYLSGNVVVASGKGIDFSATANSSGTMTSELLDDYEEGTWTPTLTASTGNPTVTYQTQKGRYVKVGQLVHVAIDLRWSAQSGGSGNTFIAGFPFTNGDAYSGGQIFESSSSLTWGSGRTVLGFELQQNNSQGSVLVSGTGTGTASLNISNVGSGSGYFIFSFTYRSAS